MHMPMPELLLQLQHELEPLLQLQPKLELLLRFQHRSSIH